MKVRRGSLADWFGFGEAAPSRYPRYVAPPETRMDNVRAAGSFIFGCALALVIPIAMFITLAHVFFAVFTGLLRAIFHF